MLHLRRPDVCIVCGVSLAAGCRASWDPTARTVTCAKCAQASGEGPGPGPPDPEHPLDQGRPGASAAREYRKRKRRREARTRQAHPRVGGLLLALRREPRQEAAFRLGELGEKTTASFLERRTLNAPVMLLHDRRMPEVRGNIDHLAITPTGVFVIDAKNVKGKVRITQPLLGAAKLLIAGRNRTSYLDGLDRQVLSVRRALAATGHADVPVHGVLCFTAHADFPLLGVLRIRGYRLHHRWALARRLKKSGPLSGSAIEQLAQALALALPPA
jgi:hypothetical protein